MGSSTAGSGSRGNATYVVARLLHFVVYGTGQIHDIRATFWTIGSAIIIAMYVIVLKAGLSFV